MPGIFGDKIEESKPVLPRRPRNHFGFVVEEGSKDPAPIVPLYGRVSFYGETPEVTFLQLMTYYEKTPQVKLAVDTINEMIFGTNLIINVDKEYEDAKEILDKWNEQTQFYEKMQALGITLLSCGNALLEKLDEKKLQNVLEVDMTTIVGKHRDETGMRVEYYMQQVPGYQPKPLGQEFKDSKGNPDAHIRFVEFNLTNYSRKEWGRSIFYALATPRTVNGVKVKPLIEDFWEAEDAMSRIFHNFASPMMFITYAEADKEFIDKKVQEYKKMKPGDALIGTRKPEIDIIQSDAKGRFDKFIDHMDSTVEVGTQFSNQLFTAGYTARASSQTTHDLINKKVRKFQKYICDKIKNEIYKPILIANNYTEDDVNSMNLMISFENDDFTDFVPQDVINMVINGVMTINEARNWAKNQGLDLFDDEWVSQWRIAWLNKQLKQGTLGDDVVTTPQTPVVSMIPPKSKESKRICEACSEGQHAYCEKKKCRCDNNCESKNEYNPYEIETYFLSIREESDDGTWVTINGTHVLIGKNDTVASAFKRTTGKDLPPKSRIEPGKTGIPQMQISTKPPATDAGKQTLTKNLDSYLNKNSDDANEFEADNYAFDVKTQGDKAYVNYAGGYKKDPEKSSFFGHTIATIDHTGKVMLIHDSNLPNPFMGKLLSRSASVHGLSVNHD